MSARTTSALLPATLLLSCGLLLLAGCSSQAAEPRGGAVQATASQAGGTLVVGLAAEPDSLNVYLARGVESAWLANRILPRLFREVMPDGARPGGLVPEAAEQWRAEDGGRSIVLTLRPPVACADLQFTLRAQTSPDVGWRGASLKRRITAIECADARTARVRFDGAYPGQLMDVNDLNILPASLARIPFAAWRATDWAKELPPVGPFRIGAVRPGQEIVLERNGGAARLARVVLRVVPDATSRVTQLLAGDLDLVPGLTPDDARRIAKDPSVRVERRHDWGYTYVGWNTRAPHFADARVRRALTLALDRQALVDVLLHGEGEVPASPLLAPLPEHDPALRPHATDRAQARRLLDEAGLVEKNGRRFTFELVVQAGNALRRQAAQLVQQDLQQVGVEVRIVPVENSVFYKTLAGRKMDAWVGGWRVSSRVDMTEMLHATSCPEEGNNYGCWSHPEADRIALQARDALDPALRAAAWRSWERLFHDEQPYTMLFRGRQLTGVSRRVHGAASLSALDVLEGVETWTVD